MPAPCHWAPFGPIDIPYLHWDKPDLYAADSAKIYAYSKGVGTLFSEDAQSIAILVKIEPNLSKQETDTVLFRDEGSYESLCL